MTRTLLIILSMFFSFFLSPEIRGQEIIKGVVIDGISRKPLKDVNVIITGKTQGTATGTDGDFSIYNFGIGGPFELRISFMGYRDTVFTYVKPDTIFLYPAVHRLNSVVVSADRHEENINEIPQRIDQIDNCQITHSAIQNTDEILYMASGIYNDRHEGIYSRNSGVTMRGMNSTARVLVLYDGAPLNKADGGGINWNRIDPDFIDKVEIVKGPSSTIYGGNAFAGVINILPPDSLPYSFRFKLNGGYGTYNTYEIKNTIAAKIPVGKRNWYLILNNFYRKGQGYHINPDSLKTEYDTTLFIGEYGMTAQTGFNTGKRSLGVTYSYWDDIRSDGVKVYEELGSYNKFSTHFGQVKYRYRNNGNEWLILGYLQKEEYFRQNETVSQKTGKYKLYDIVSPRTDLGATVSKKTKFGSKNVLITGCDFRYGYVDSREIYYTSTDVFHKKGSMAQAAAFVNYDRSFPDKRLFFTTGLRIDYAEFSNGSFVVETPSQSSEFINNYPVDFSDNRWTSLSPKAGLRYIISSRLSAYISYSHGFRPPMLDDMCTNRNITKGFKIANPKLRPEKLDNIEAGLDLVDFKDLTIRTSAWYSAGSDFQYFVFTGDSVDTGGDTEKAVLIRDNIASADISGVEISAIYIPVKSLTLIANYTYSHSIISDFSGSQYQANDITGKFIMEVPANIFNAVITFEKKYGYITLQYSFVDKRCADDENTLFSPAYDMWNLKIGTGYYKNFALSLTVHDILDRPYLDYNYNLSPGRTVFINLHYQFSK